MTCVIDGTRYDDAKLSLAAGYAALVGCRESDYALRCRWPNDVVENKPPHRKVAGVLIEKTRGLAFVGIGVNVLHRDSDWPEDLRGRAVSLKRLGFGNFRISVAQRVLFYLFQGLAMSNRALAEEWRHHDILIGTQRAFVHNNHQYFGLVLDIDPLNAIRLRMADGREVSLPAHSTSLVHE